MQDFIAKIIFYLGFFILSFILGVFAKDIPAITSFFKYLDSGIQTIKESSYSETIDGNLFSWHDENEEIHDGYILLSYHYKTNPAVLLVDNKGKTVNSWSLAKEFTNPKTLEYFSFDKEDETIVFDIADSHLLKNGDLIASQDIMNLSSYRGQRLVRMDKDSNIIWQINGAFHHDLSLDEDENIYAMTIDFRKVPSLIWQEESIDTPLTTDDIINIISPEGKILKTYSLIDGLINSDFKAYFTSAILDLPQQEFTLKDGQKVFDLFHVNHIQYISAKLAKTNILFEEGDFLVSLRGISAIGIYRPSLNKFTYLRRGPWLHQHYVKLQENGLIYIYDNEGGSKFVASNDETLFKRHSRVISYNIESDISEVLIDQPQHFNLHSFWRGYYKKIGEDNYIYNSPDTGRVMQVKNQKTIWEIRTIEDPTQNYIPYTKSLTTAKYYDQDSEEVKIFRKKPE